MTPTGSPQRQQARAHLLRGRRQPKRTEPADDTDQTDLFATLSHETTPEVSR